MCILGQTIHNTFRFQFGNASQGLGDKARDIMRTVLRNLRFVIIDEYSMVPSDFIFKISKRLSEIKERPGELFGGVCMILLGDPLQLKPVRARYPWEEPKNQQHRNFNVGGTLWSEFIPIVLRTNHRQGKSLEYAQLCEKIRLGGFNGLESSDIAILESRIHQRNDPQLPENSVYIFARNAAVNEMNAEKLSQLAGRLFTVEAVVKHKTLRNFKPFVVPATGCIRNTNLLKTLQFKINSKIFLSYNVNTNDSLVNGAFGKVVGVKEDSSGNLLEIHVNFLNEASGKETAKGCPDLRKKYGVPTVPVRRLEAQPRIGSNNAGVTSTCTVYMFPLRLADAVTIHKVSKPFNHMHLFSNVVSGPGSNI